MERITQKLSIPQRVALSLTRTPVTLILKLPPLADAGDDQSICIGDIN